MTHYIQKHSVQNKSLIDFVLNFCEVCRMLFGFPSKTSIFGGLFALFSSFLVHILSFLYMAVRVVLIKKNADPSEPQGDRSTQRG